MLHTLFLPLHVLGHVSFLHMASSEIISDHQNFNWQIFREFEGISTDRSVARFCCCPALVDTSIQKGSPQICPVILNPSSTDRPLGFLSVFHDACVCVVGLGAEESWRGRSWRDH